MLYLFDDDFSVGEPRINTVQVAFYDMERNGDCFDEDIILYKKSEGTLDSVMPYVETEEDEGHSDRSRVFLHMKDGPVYEVLLKRIEDFSSCTNFGGK